MLDGELWVGTKKKETKEGERGELERGREILSTATFTQIPNHKTTKKEKNGISKQYSKQGKTGEVERNFKTFDNPVFINPGRYNLPQKKNVVSACSLYRI